MKPNIVYIMADDMGYGDVACFNPDSKIPTPNMDRIASEGMRLTDCHSSSAVCTPSRYSVLTGRYCWRSHHKRHVIWTYHPPLIDPARMTVASLLKTQGYRTAAVGKWHVGLDWQPKDPHETNDLNAKEDTGWVDYHKPFLGGPLDLGFDYFFGIAGSLDMPPYCFLENRCTVGIPDVPKKDYFPQQRLGFQTPDWDDEKVDSTFAEKAVAWLEQTVADDPDSPFFLYLTPSAPHRPCQPPDFAKGKSDAGPRGDMVWTVDWLIGQVDDALDRLGVKDDTLLVITSDNGAQAADVDGELHGHKSCGDLRGYKTDIWEGGHRVPCIARWPGQIDPGSACQTPVCLVDLLATLAEVTEQELPPHGGEDSVSLLPLLTGRPEDHHRPPIVHHSVYGMFGLRDGDWKLCDGLGSGGATPPQFAQPLPGGPSGQLYNLREDLGETRNHFLDQPDRVETMNATINEFKLRGRSRG
jgi:arylsulfatase A